MISLFSALFVAVFIVEFAPEWMSNILQPVVRFLASVPSVIYGLIGVVVLVPFIGNNLVTEPQKASVAGVISLSGYSLLAATLILTVMIAPIMISIFSDGLRPVRPGWIEGSLASGVNRWHDLEDQCAPRGPRSSPGPCSRSGALGRGGDAGDGLGIRRLRPEPRRRADLLLRALWPLAPTIIKSIDQLGSKPMNATLYAIAALLLFSRRRRVSGRARGA